jgi:hypothetical protein
MKLLLEKARAMDYEIVGLFNNYNPNPPLSGKVS